MEKYYLIHNPRCSKSRETLTLLKSHGVEPEIVDYLNGELTHGMLQTITRVLPAREIIRTKEDEFKLLQMDLDNVPQVIEAILRHPKILERPILMKGSEAVIGRPPENILKLLKN